MSKKSIWKWWNFTPLKNVFYLPEVSRWSYLIENARQNDIALKIDTALFTVEKNNPALKALCLIIIIQGLIWMLQNWLLCFLLFIS